MFKIIKKEIQFGEHTLILETGKVARQADASVIAQMGETVVLACVVAHREPKVGNDFFPLTVNYFEKYYAAGKFPGGFFKRENRPTEREVLTSRLIDRPIRPLFPRGFLNEVQVTITVLSYDPNHQPDIVATLAASAALSISGVPFDGPVGAARVGYKDGEFILNPAAVHVNDENKLDLIVAGTKDAVLMVESEAKELSEEIMLQAVMFGHKAFKNVIEGIREMADEVGNEHWENVSLFDNSELVARINKMVGSKLTEAYKPADKLARYAQIDALKKEVRSELIEKEEMDDSSVNNAFKALQSQIVRELALGERLRIDGRSPEDIRQISVETNLLPRTHGSALFTRGETQALVITTLGSGDDEQMVDDLEGIRKDKFMLHYNFPPYSVGETGRMGAPGRREIGHGKLAYRAISPQMPTPEEFPYTIRVVSEITESNGSSSMATVCGTSLALMDAGVPLRSPIAGIAMGLIMEGDRSVVLSDIMGDEDYLGDMDFKVAGTNEGITALQMDIKIKGITEEIMQQALAQAKVGRAHILNCMSEALTESRSKISKNAPQIHSFKIPKEKIGELIGPGGKMIRSIIEQTNVKIDIGDDGIVKVASVSATDMEAALAIINDIIAVPEIGKIYDGKVIKITDFGAFVGIMKNCEGLVHVSEMSNQPVKHPRDFVSEGQLIKVKVIDIDKLGRVKLSIKAIKSSTDDEQVSNNDDKVPSSNDQPITESKDREQRPRNNNPRHSRNNNRDNNRDNKSPAKSDNSTPSPSVNPVEDVISSATTPVASDKASELGSDKKNSNSKRRFKRPENNDRNTKFEADDSDNSQSNKGERKPRFF